MSKKITLENLTDEELKELREDVVLNSLLVNDYENRFGIKSLQVCEFFDEYVSYLESLLKSEHPDKEASIENILAMDNFENLKDWHAIYFYYNYEK